MGIPALSRKTRKWQSEPIRPLVISDARKIVQPAVLRRPCAAGSPRDRGQVSQHSLTIAVLADPVFEP
jgi:hypothetical protein